MTASARRALALLVVCASSTACFAVPGSTTGSGLRVSGALLDQVDVDFDGAGAPLGGDGDRRSFEAAAVIRRDDPNGAKLSTGEVGIGSARYEDGAGATLDAIEVLAGGRLHVRADGPRPFLALHGVATIPEEVPGFDLGVVLGARAGAGLEIPLGSSGFYVDLTLDYTFTLLSGESSPPGLETDVDGLAARFGLGIDL